MGRILEEGRVRQESHSQHSKPGKSNVSIREKKEVVIQLSRKTTIKNKKRQTNLSN